jgi:hypothetical protein
VDEAIEFIRLVLHKPQPHPLNTGSQVCIVDLKALTGLQLPSLASRRPIESPSDLIYHASQLLSSVSLPDLRSANNIIQHNKNVDEPAVTQAIAGAIYKYKCPAGDSTASITAFSSPRGDQDKLPEGSSPFGKFDPLENEQSWWAVGDQEPSRGDVNDGTGDESGTQAGAASNASTPRAGLIGASLLPARASPARTGNQYTRGAGDGDDDGGCVWMAMAQGDKWEGYDHLAPVNTFPPFRALGSTYLKARKNWFGLVPRSYGYLYLPIHM